MAEISKRSAEMWRNLRADERAHWDEVAAKDKQRYMVEKASYTGPWQIPWKRSKKVSGLLLTTKLIGGVEPAVVMLIFSLRFYRILLLPRDPCQRS